MDSSNFNIAVLDSKQFSITFSPDSQLTYNATLKLTTLNHGDVFVNLAGEGVVPEINVLNNNLNFGIVSLGGSSFLEIPIQNTGSDTLFIYQFDNNYSVFSFSDSTLIIAPDSSKDTLLVSFTPDSAKSYQDSLIIYSDDPNQSRIAISLFGEGSGPVLSVDQLEMDFGMVNMSSDTTLKSRFVAESSIWGPIPSPLKGMVTLGVIGSLQPNCNSACFCPGSKAKK